MEDAVLWRAFPWDPTAPPDSPFSPTHVPEGQVAGRFDLGGSGVLYFAESPEHAVAEKIQRYRNFEVAAPDLTQAGHRLAIASVRLSPRARAGVADLCDPDELARRRIRPDTLASRDFVRTRAVAVALFEEGRTGLRWWSAFWGDWHTVVAFGGRLSRRDLVFGDPEPIGLEHPVVRLAAAELGIRLAGKRRSRRLR
jgi:hypothetical protein